MTTGLQVAPLPEPDTVPLFDCPPVSVEGAGDVGPLGATTGAELLPEEGAAGGV